MSYLNVPRLHFSGGFQADPSTVNNNDNNWDPTVKYTEEPPTYLPGDPNNRELYNNSVYWNPNGTHNWKLLNCTVKGAANDQGVFDSPVTDPIIGARVESVGTFPAKIVDLDPDNQAVSQIWGLQLRVSLFDATNPSQVVASVTGTMPGTCFCDLWNRTRQSPSNGTMSACFQALLCDVVFANVAASPLLQALQAATLPGQLSIRFTVDSFQSDSNQSNFTHGRIVGTIGPAFAGEAPRSTPRRLAPVQFWSTPPFVSSNLGNTPSILSPYGAAGAVWDSARSALILDLGNTAPTRGAPTTVPSNGWPVAHCTFQVTIPGPSVSPIGSNMRLKSGASIALGAPSVLGTVRFSDDDYLKYAGVVEMPVAADLVELIARQPLKVTDVTDANAPAVAVQEDALGRYVDVDLPFLRLDPGAAGQVTLWATKFGKPWGGERFDLSVQSPALANNPGPPKPPPQQPPPQAGNSYATWYTGVPEGVVTFNAPLAPTDANGTCQVVLNAGNPGFPRMYRDGQRGPAGQVYLLGGSWQSFGQIFLFSGAPINLLVFSEFPVPDSPTWDDDVGPILSVYARLYPYMKGIIDLSDYNTVVANAPAIQRVLNLPVSDPHHMPVVRDLDASRLAIINKWFVNKMPKSASANV